MSALENRQPVKERLFQTGTILFAEKGFDGVSVREICKHAGTSMNMIHHYFGNKEGLFDAIVASFTEKVFAFPLRLLEKEVQTKDEFVTLVELFFEETLTALIDQRHILQVITRHEVEASAMSELIQNFVKFLKITQEKGFVQAGIEPELMSGFIMDRLATQVLYAPQIAKYSNYDLIGDPDYRARWTRSNLNLFLYGLVSQ
ncbi:MAG: TetR/AcrR family transcriptional regulator [Kordiimonas sp.]